jgi:hypothetical protein
MLLDGGGGSDDDDDGNDDECFLQGWSYSWIVRWRADYRPDRPFPHISHVSPRIATAYREEYFEIRDFI